MAATNLYTSLQTGDAAFNEMIRRFGVVTVMNAKVFDVAELNTKASSNAKDYFEDKTAYEIYTGLTKDTPDATPICELDTLKIANVTIEGPTKTITGGQYSNPLIKFGKTARLEMQDALGDAKAIEALCGGLVEYTDDSSPASGHNTIVGLHNGPDFSGPKLILGDTFFIDQTSGKQVKVAIIFYQMLPDSLFNLTQDAEGDATVFDMNGDLLTTDIMVGTPYQATRTETLVPHGVFYSIINPKFAYSAS